jgi:hypothetical protein
MSVDFGKEGVSQKTKTFGRKKERKKERDFTLIVCDGNSEFVPVWKR